PAGAWVTQGGSPARTRATDTAALHRAPTLAWRYVPEGTLVGEPRVWGDHVVLEEERGALRVLVLLDRVTGRRIGAELSFRTTLSLSPALWGDTVVVRAEPRRLLAARVGRRGLTSSWNWRVDGDLGEPLLVERTCHVVVGTSLVAFELGTRTPLWSLEGEFAGPLALTPGKLVALAASVQ